MKLMRTPKSLDLEITGACNLRCRYCSHFSSEGDVDQDLATEEWLAFLDKLGRCSVLEVCLQGGEPFMREDLRQIIDGIVRNRMRFSVLTNGTLITDETAAHIASTGRCNAIQVSIDGSMEITHDAFRGRGSFGMAVAGLKTLLEHGVPATVRVTIHKRNVSDLAAVAKLLLEEIGLSSFSTNSAAHLGLCRRNREPVQLDAEEKSLAMRSLLHLTGKYEGRISASAGPLAEARMWLEMERAAAYPKVGAKSGGYLNGCGGPMTKLAVRADGVIVPCTLLPGMELGRINRDELREVWLEHPELNRFRRRSSISLRDFEFCSGCRYVDSCTGNCPAVAYTMLKDAYHPNPDACYRCFLDEGGRLPEADLTACLGDDRMIS
jgi:SynChlorMet cassette radical SAM/SPASM protein ScmE